jgi:hypothetical protein
MSRIELVLLAEVSPYPFAFFRISIAAIRVARIVKSAKSLRPRARKLAVGQFESSHLTIAMEAWKLASLKAMPPQSNIM